jgi:hypothetical protein
MTAMRRHEACEFDGHLVTCGGFPVITVQTLDVTTTRCTVVASVETRSRFTITRMNKSDNAIVAYDNYGPTFRAMELSGATTFSKLPRLPFFPSVRGLVPMPTRNLNGWLVSEERKINERQTASNPDLCTLTFCYNTVLLFMRLFYS